MGERLLLSDTCAVSRAGHRGGAEWGPRPSSTAKSRSCTGPAQQEKLYGNEVFIEIEMKSDDKSSGPSLPSTAKSRFCTGPAQEEVEDSGLRVEG